MYKEFDPGDFVEPTRDVFSEYDGHLVLGDGEVMTIVLNCGMLYGRANGVDVLLYGTKFNGVTVDLTQYLKKVDVVDVTMDDVCEKFGRPVRIKNNEG